MYTLTKDQWETVQSIVGLLALQIAVDSVQEDEVSPLIHLALSKGDALVTEITGIDTPVDDMVSWGRDAYRKVGNLTIVMGEQDHTGQWAIHLFDVIEMRHMTLPVPDGMDPAAFAAVMASSEELWRAEADDEV